MIADSVLWSASRNLIGTYLELGRASTGSEVWAEEGFQACVGPLDHPICNFAADLRLTRSSARRLAQVAEGRRSFSVYGLPTDQPVDLSALLEDAGFEQTHHLAQMVAQPEEGAAGAAIVRAEGLPERRRVAGFMAEQFFSKHAGRFRRGIVEATAQASGLALWRIERESRILGAVMVYEHEGAFGIYNLCVEASARGRGLGAAIMRSVCHDARVKGAAVTLQCELALAPWYRKLRFRQTGDVTVYGLSRFKDVDIMAL